MKMQKSVLFVKKSLTINIYSVNHVFPIVFETSLNCPRNVQLFASLKDALSGLRQFLGTESPLKMMKILFILPQELFSF